MHKTERSSFDWFREAQRCYLEHHQGCAWCGGSHRVFQTHAESQLTYYCNGCDFHVGYDRETDRYFHVPGETPAPAGSKTMLKV